MAHVSYSKHKKGWRDNFHHVGYSPGVRLAIRVQISDREKEKIKTAKRNKSMNVTLPVLKFMEGDF